MTFRPLFICWLLLLLPASASAELQQRPEWGALFRQAGTEGTFVLRSPAGLNQIYNLERAETRFIPASTFKIPHALIALESGVLRDPQQRLAWDGVKRPFAAWNQDHNLASAMAASVVPVFQRFARAIGPRRMTAALERMAYGNGAIGGGIDRFWLTGDLRISAREQVAFLQRLHSDSVAGIAPRHQAMVREVLFNEAGDGYRLYAKTGWAMDMEPAIGWWVGYVERAEGCWYFALNLDIQRPEQAAERQRIARAILAQAGVLPAP